MRDFEVGRVGKLLIKKFADAPDLKIPHMGWNNLTFPHPSQLYRGLYSGEMTYFVHSYHVLPEDPSVITPR